MSFMSSVSKNLKRTKQKAMVQFGRAEKTVDSDFNDALAHFKTHKSHTEHVLRDAKSLISSIRSSQKKMEDLSRSIGLYYSPGEGHVDSSIAESIDSSTSRIASCMNSKIDSELQTNCITPLENYVRQLSQISQRATARERLLTDMDRYNADWHKRQAKAAATPGVQDPAAQAAEQKAKQATDLYNTANRDLIHDMKALVEHRSHTMNPLICVYLRSFAAYMGTLSHEYSALASDSESRGMHHEKAPPQLSASHSSFPTPSAGVGAPTPNGQPAPAPAQAPYGSNQAPTPYAAPAAAPMPQQRPPRPTPAKSGGAARATALYEFVAEEPNELSFPVGAIITLTVPPSSSEDWWQGEYGGRSGLFPSAYVKLC